MSLTDIQIGIWNVMGGGMPYPFGGNHYYVDPVNGGDGNPGTKDAPFATIYKAYAACVDMHNDVVHLLSNGKTSGSARLSKALAQSVDSTATSGLLTWAKSATHLIGEAAPGCSTVRARIAPAYSSGTTAITEAVFGSLNFVIVTGTGCVFANFEAYQGFSTGAAAQICWTDGGRNTYMGCVINGMGDAESAASASSRSLVLSGNTGESLFYRCTIGLDTLARTAANASLEFAGGTPRNKFVECVFPAYATGSGSGGYIMLAAASGMDRWQIFERCKFLNGILSGGSVMTTMAIFAAGVGSYDGYVLLDRCTSVGFTHLGNDTATKARLYVDGAPPTAATSSLAVATSA